MPREKSLSKHPNVLGAEIVYLFDEENLFFELGTGGGKWTATPGLVN